MYFYQVCNYYATLNEDAISRASNNSHKHSISEVKRQLERKPKPMVSSEVISDGWKDKCTGKKCCMWTLKTCGKGLKGLLKCGWKYGNWLFFDKIVPYTINGIWYLLSRANVNADIANSRIPHLNHKRKIIFVGKGVGVRIIQYLGLKKSQFKNLMIKFVFLDPSLGIF